MVEMIDAPWAGRPVRIRWRKRRWICLEYVCAVVSFIEQYPQVQPVLTQAAGDPSRFEDVRVIGVDEHIWHHRDPRDWLDERGEAFRRRVEIATLDPFQGCKNTIDDQLEDAVCVLDAFHIVKLAGAAVEVAYQCAQDPRDVFREPTPARGRRLAEQLIERLPSCPISEIARLGKTLRRGRTAFLAYFDTDGASNGGTEAINGIIELGRRIAAGFRNVEHYRLRMLLITGGLDASPHTQL